jgi:histidine triad (HIT) family protein
MGDCIFCKIASGKIPCQKIYEDDLVLACDDIHPMAPVHVIVIPKKHVSTFMDLSALDSDLMTALFLTAQKVAKIKGVAEKGFRTVINCNEEGGQVVFHLHMHLLGGEKLKDDLA